MSEAFNPAASITVTGADNIRAASLIALRGALRLEVRGLKRRGRSARAIANEHMGTNLRTAKATYPVFDAWLVAQYPGRIGSRPLD